MPVRDAWRLAAGTFLAFPVSPPARVDRVVAGAAMALAPATALPAAAAWLCLGVVASHGWLPAGVAAALALGVTALASRAMHLDGLADTADGLSASYDRERALDVMRRGDTGPAGAAAVVIVLLVQYSALATLLSRPGDAALAAAALVSSRLAAPVASRAGVPAARPGGLGATVAGSVGPGRLALSALGVALATGLASWLAPVPWYAAGLVPLASGAGAWLVTQRARRRLGGVTGDVIGAAIEVALAAALVVASVVTSVAATD